MRDHDELSGEDTGPHSPAEGGSSPLHRDPQADGDDYGCCDEEANGRVAQLIEELIAQIESGGFVDGEALIAAMRRGLESIGDDTIVKENVRNALLEVVERSGLQVDWRGIYGW